MRMIKTNLHKLPAAESAKGLVNEAIATVSECTSPIPHILLVDDSNIALLALEQIMRQTGYYYTSAMTGEEALEIAKHHSFDLIITDLGLPGLSGFGFTLELRAFEREAQKNPVPIIGLTVHAQKNIKHECEQTGMNDVFIKPLTPSAWTTIQHTYL